MNFRQLQDRVRALCALEGYADASPPPDWAAAVNHALRTFSWEGEYNVRETTITTTSGQAVYSLSAPAWKLVTDVYYRSNLGENSTPLTPSSETNERAYDPMWRMVAAGEPLYYWLEEPNALRLHPKPSTGGVQVLVVGVCAEPELSSDTDTPICPDIYHEDVARLAAWIVAQSYATGEAMQRAISYRTEALDKANELKVDRFHQARAGLFRRVRPVPKRRVIL